VNIRVRRDSSPTTPTPEPPGLNSVLARNIQSLIDRRRAEAAQAKWQDRAAEAITRFTGSMRFVTLHLLLFGGWIAVNLGLVPVLPRFDPTFVVLAMVASVEAIFLSTFVLIAQNRMTAEADKRADLNLQISLLAEHEVTRVIGLLDAITRKLGIETGLDPEIEELEEDVAPEAVLDRIESASGSKPQRQERKSQGEAAAAPQKPAAPDRFSSVPVRR
jgi:uncharacterized membrane protein